MMRRTTPVVTNPDGSRSIVVQRACNGCGNTIGDVTDDEMERCVGGLLLPDVRHECPFCAMFLAEEQS